MKYFLAFCLLVASCVPMTLHHDAARPVYQDSMYDWKGTEQWYENHSIQIQPPKEFQRYWKLDERCSGLTGNFKQVKFFVYYTYNDEVYILNDSSFVVAWWTKDNNGIYILSRHASDSAIVRHEMIHALRQEGGHPKSIFQDRCHLPIYYNPLNN